MWGGRRHVFQCVSFYCRREESACTRGAWGITPTFQAPVPVSLAVEGRSSNGVINFFFHAPLFSLNLACMLALDLARQNLYLLQGHTQQCFPGLQSWPGLAQVLGTPIQCPGSLLLCQFVTEIPSNRIAWAGLPVMVLRLSQGKQGCRRRGMDGF